MDLTFPNYESESEPSLPSNPPSHEISSSLALEPLSITVHPYHMPLEFETPCESLEPLEPTECAEIDHLYLVPHLSREDHFTEPPWHMKERERETFELSNVADSIVFNTAGATYEEIIVSPPSGWVHDSPPSRWPHDVDSAIPPSGWTHFMDYRLLNFKKRRK